MSVDRIVPAMSYRNFLEDLAATRLRLDADSRSVSSGRRVNMPSDDPASIAKLFQFKDALSGLEQFNKNVQSGKAVLSFTDSVLDSMVRSMNVVFERGTAAATGTQTPQYRDAAGREIAALRDQLLSMANSTFQGNYIFAGTQTGTQPFVINGGVVSYVGDGSTIQIDIGPGQSGTTNIPGSQVFNLPGTTRNLFNVLDSLVSALRTPAPDQTAQIANAMSEFSKAFDALRAGRSILGGHLATMERAKQVLDNQRFQLVSSISTIEDADMAESISNLIKEQSVESAILSVGARISRRSLFDFIG